MIKSEQGTVVIEGNGIEIMADICVLLKAYREMLGEKGISKEAIEDNLQEIVRDSEKNEENLKNGMENFETFNKFMKALLEDVFKEGKL